jgi:quinol monooxygenase YgiN
MGGGKLAGPKVAGSNPASPTNATIVHERTAMYAAEFTLQAKPGHYAEVAALYSAFAADFLSDHPALESVMILGDEASGVVRGIGVFTDRPAADSVNSDPQFAAFNDARGDARGQPEARGARAAAPVHGGLTRADTSGRGVRLRDHRSLHTAPAFVTAIPCSSGSLPP